MSEMTRKFAMQVIKQNYAHNPQKFWSLQRKQACEMALDDMEKMEKIEEIVGNYGFENSWVVLKKIREVLDGTKQKRGY